jgi:cobalt/nickel transport system permease protein
MWAVHISDGILAPDWWGGGFLVAGLFGLLGARRVRDDEIPKIALLTAAFFVASLIHVRVGPTSVHLLLNGLLGVLLGWRVFLAIPVGLLLQVILIHHGGFTTLGINTCVMAFPALLGWATFVSLRRAPWVRQAWFGTLLVGMSGLLWTLSLVFSVSLLWSNWGGSVRELQTDWALWVTFHPLVLLSAVFVAGAAVWAERRLGNAAEFPLGLLIGELTVLLTVSLNCVVLIAGGEQNWQTPALILLVAHLPLAVLEGVVLGFTVGFLVRVKPAMLGWPDAVPGRTVHDPAELLDDPDAAFLERSGGVGTRPQGGLPRSARQESAG